MTKHYLGISSTAELIRTLERNPFIAMACGIDCADDIPHKSTFSRFFKKLTGAKYLHLVKDVSRSLVRRCYSELPGFGERVAMDSSTLQAWSNGGKTPKADPEANWSVKKNTHGKTEFVYGYKLHLLADTEYELPIAANVSAGNVHDSQRASNLMSESRFTHARNPQYVMADPAYFSREFELLLHNQYCATPIILANKAHKKHAAQVAEEQVTVEFKALYSQRQAVERAFSRPKGQRSLNDIKVRRLRKVTLHCYLSLVAMQAANLMTC